MPKIMNVKYFGRENSNTFIKVFFKIRHFTQFSNSVDLQSAAAAEVVAQISIRS